MRGDLAELWDGSSGASRAHRRLEDEEEDYLTTGASPRV
jgi:hypothetical protein